MDPNAIALLQQLASNPHMVSQLQDVLTAVGNSSGHAPKTANNINAVSSNFDASPAVSLSTAKRGLTTAARPQETPVLSANGPHHGNGSVGNNASFGPVSHRYPPASSMPTISLQKYEQLERLLHETDAEKKAQERAAAAAEERARGMEKEVQRLSQRIEQLTAAISDQRQQQRTCEETHQLAIDELKHTYDSVLRRKEEVHEESLRQLLKARQLFAVAKRFEDTVRTHGGGLADGAIAMNVRNNSSSTTHDAHRSCHQLPGKMNQATATEDSERGRDFYKSESHGTLGSSGVKRERSAIVEERDAHPPYHYYGAAGKRKEELKSRTDGGGDRAVAITSRSGNFSSSGKKSSTLLSNSGNSSRKRRTPRTPSLTNADRIAGSRSPPPPVPSTGGISMKLATPTPLVSAVKGGNTTTNHHPRSVPSSKLSGAVLDAADEDRVMSNTLTPIGIHARPPLRRVEGAVNDSEHTAEAQQQQQQQRFVSQYSSGAGRGLYTARPKDSRPLHAFPTSHSQQQQQQQQQAAVPSTASGASSAVGGPTRSPSPVNPKRGPVLPRRFIYTGLKDPEPERLSAAIDSVGEDAAVLNSDLDEPPPFATTHIVVRGTPRSVKALCGVVSGKWLVPPEYVYNSNRAGFWLDEYEEGGLRLFPPPLKCQRFLLTMEHAGVKEKIAQVIEYGGGEVVNKTASLPAERTNSAARQQWTERGVIVISSGDDLLRYATQTQS